MIKEPPVRRKQSERSAESAKRLLDAAVQIIAEKGFDKATTAEIGERAGYSREMVRHRYGSKQQLLESLLDIEIKDRLLKPPKPGMTGLQEAINPILLMRELAKTNPDLLRTFFILCFESVGPIPSLGDWMRKWLSAYQVMVANALKKGQEDGSVRSELDVKAEARKLIFYGCGLGYCWILNLDSVNFVRSMKQWSDTLQNEWSSGD